MEKTLQYTRIYQKSFALSRHIAIQFIHNFILSKYNANFRYKFLNLFSYPA